MIPHPDSMILLTGIRLRELQDEAVWMRLIREARGNGPTPHAVVGTACRQLRAMLVYARQQLELIRWTQTLQRRGAFPR
jgi:hypothetical protein